MSLNNACSRASLFMWEISESASSWLLLDCSPHEMTFDLFPAIIKSISFCSKYVCNFFAKMEVNCCFVLVWDNIYFKLVSLISKAWSNDLQWIRQGLHFQEAQIAWSSLEKYCNRCQTQWQLRDMIPQAFPRPDKTIRQVLKGFHWCLLWHFLDHLHCVYYHYICTGTLRSWTFGVAGMFC